jgi:hypothetical protein
MTHEKARARALRDVKRTLKDELRLRNGVPSQHLSACRRFIRRDRLGGEVNEAAAAQRLVWAATSQAFLDGLRAAIQRVEELQNDSDR